MAPANGDGTTLFERPNACHDASHEHDGERDTSESLDRRTARRARRRAPREVRDRPPARSWPRAVRRRPAPSTTRSRRRRRPRRSGGRLAHPSAPRSCSASASWSPPTSDELVARITREHGKVLATPRRGQRGLEVVEFACGLGHLLKGEHSAGVSRRRLLLAAPAARRRGRHHAVQLPGDGPAVDGAGALACGNAFILKPSEQLPSPSHAALPSCSPRPGLPDGAFSVVHGDKEAVDALLTHPGIAAVSLRRLHAGRPPRLRDRHRSRQARAGARRRQEPRRRAARRRPRPDRRRPRLRRLRLGRPALHGGLRRGLGRRRRRTAARPGPRAHRGARRRRGHRPRVRHGPARLQRALEHVTGLVDAGVEEGAELLVDGRGLAVPAAAATSSGRACSTSSCPGWRLDEEIFGRSSSSCAGRRTRGARAGQRHPYGNGAAIFTNDGGAARLSSRTYRGDGRRQRPDPGPDGLPLVRRLEGLAVRRPARARTGRRALLHPRQGGDPRWTDPSHAGVDLGFPTQT